MRMGRSSRRKKKCEKVKSEKNNSDTAKKVARNRKERKEETFLRTLPPSKAKSQLVNFGSAPNCSRSLAPKKQTKDNERTRQVILNWASAWPAKRPDFLADVPGQETIKSCKNLRLQTKGLVNEAKSTSRDGR